MTDPHAAGRYRTGMPPWDSWQRCRAYVAVHPTAIVAPNSTVQLWQAPRDAEPRVTIGELSHVFSSFNLLRPQSRISVGARCQLGNVNIVCATGISIGDDVLMAWGITILDSDHHSLDWRERCKDVLTSRADHLQGRPLGATQSWRGVGMAPVSIGNKCWVGCNVTILKGVTIGEGAVIGAGSVVTRSIPAWHAAAGNPARPVKALPPDESSQAAAAPAMDG